MQKKKNKDIPVNAAHENELLQELERLVNENNALMKVLKKISPEKVQSGKRSGPPEKGKETIK